MADRAITALTQATALGSSDLFVLSQSNQAKSATWQLIISYLTTALDGHGGIQTIEKTSTSGLVDTYTVTLADQTTYSFTVTNAKSIASITKTPAVPPSLTDTYTITYNDGDTDTFTMDNGRGIASIVKTSAVAPSLTDTYTITYNDATTYQFMLTNGKGISNVSKAPAVYPSLTDTYTITYNDGTTYSFDVDNGKAISSIEDKWAVSDSNSVEPSTWYSTLQTMTPTDRYLWHYQIVTFNDATTLNTSAAVVGVYGDTGQNWYVHIKYSSARPTRDSDMGDIPDNWIGIYSGTSETAPTTYTSYSWFEYKGEKGDTGDASSITSQSVTYMEGTSGTVVPSGSWSPSIPPVAQGNYLWTRTILNFNDGSTVTSYSVARMGVDGSGAVSTVNGVSPDGNGNVALEAEDIPTDNNLSIQSRINAVENSIETHDSNFAVEYDPTSTYSVGDYCIYENRYYQCITAVSTPDTFDPLKWQETSVSEISVSLKNTLTQLDGAKAAKVDLVGNIILNGTNTTGADITAGTYFYNNGVLRRAIATISGNPAGSVTDQNSETVTAGGLNSLNDFSDVQDITNSQFSAGTIKAIKTRRIIQLIFEGIKTTTGLKTNIIPDRYIPAYNTRCVLLSGNATKSCLVLVNTAGAVDWTPSDASVGYYGSMTYIGYN